MGGRLRWSDSEAVRRLGAEIVFSQHPDRPRRGALLPRHRPEFGPQMACFWHFRKRIISDFPHLEYFFIFRVLTMPFSGLKNKIEGLQSNNRRKLKSMISVMLTLALFGALLLGLIHVLRLDRSRKRITV